MISEIERKLYFFYYNTWLKELLIKLGITLEKMRSY